MRKIHTSIILLIIVTLSFGQRFNIKENYSQCNGTKLETFIPLNDSTVYVVENTPLTPCGYSLGRNDQFIQSYTTGYHNGTLKRVYTQANVSVLLDSTGLVDSSILHFKLFNGTDSTEFISPDYITKTLSYTKDSEDNYHIIAIGYIPTQDYISSCFNAKNIYLIHIKTNTAINSTYPIPSTPFLTPTEFTQFNIIRALDDASYLPNIKIQATQNGLLQTEINNDSIQISFFNNSYQLQHNEQILLDNNYSYSEVENIFPTGTYYYQNINTYSFNSSTSSYDTTYNILKFDNNGNMIEQKKWNKQYEYNNWINDYTNKHVFFFPYNGNQTIAKFTNTQNDTIKSVVLPYNYRKIFYTTENHFISITDSIEINGFWSSLYLTVHEYDSSGNFLYSYAYNEIDPSLFGQTMSFENTLLGWNYFIDKNDIIYLTTSSNSGMGCPHGSSSLYVNQYYTTYIKNKYKVQGIVTFDENQNCIGDYEENFVKDILIELRINNKSYFTTSLFNGQYSLFPQDTGHAKIIVHLENQLFYTKNCNDTIDVYISDTSISHYIPILLQNNNCTLPKVSVKISTPYLRRCHNNIYTLSIKNEINDTIDNATVDVTLDDDLLPVDTAFNNAINLGNNTFRFNFNNLPPLSIVRKNLLVNLNCNTAIEGEAHCVKAVATPYQICTIANLPRLTSESLCRNDSVIFTITKNALSNNYQPFYRVIANDSIIEQGFLTFINDRIELSFNNIDGKTLRFESYQIPSYPNEDTIVSTAIEGCGNNNFSTGYLTLFEQDDDVPFIDVDCKQNVTNFESNSKLAEPGNGTTSNILPDRTIEYTIQFQNKESFIANVIIITDVLSEYLDLSTFQFISSSHDILNIMFNNNTVQFLIYPIELPSVNSDTLGSMGFIKFSLRPKADLPDSIIINNTAQINLNNLTTYQTNNVSRRFSNFLNVSLISSVRNSSNKINHQIFPNPFNEQINLNFDYNRATQLTIYSLNGNIIQQSNSNNNRYLLNRNTLPAGMYLYMLTDLKNGILLDSGKIIAQ